MTADSFAPRWAASPGEILKFWLVARGLHPRDLADRAGRSEAWVEDILEGALEVDEDTALVIAEATDTSPSFWTVAESQFETDKDNVTLDVWSRGIPISHMASMGWITDAQSWHGNAQAALRFFGVESVEQWNYEYGSLLASVRLRSERPGQARNPALVTWMRACELRAARTQEGFSEPALREALEELRACSKWPDPARFIPFIQETLARSGVRFVIAKAPPGSWLSGGAWRDGDGSPIIGLTARGLTDDRLWFSLYHEAAHVILGSDPETSFADELESELYPGISSSDGSDEPHIERAADSLAAQYLLARPEGLLDVKSRSLQVRDIVRLAALNETSPGIVVGHLQHLGLLDFSRRNALKRRYRWSGPNLGKK